MGELGPASVVSHVRSGVRPDQVGFWGFNLGSVAEGCFPLYFISKVEGG